MSSRPLCHLSRQVMGRLQTFKQSRVSYMLPRTAYSTAPSACGFNDYETEKATFKIDTPSHFNFVTDVIEKWAQYGPKQTPAFWWMNDAGQELQWTFSDLAEKTRRVANILSGPCGLSRGDRIMVILPRIPQWWLINLAAISTGMVLIPGTTQLTQADLLKRIVKSDTKCLITDEPTTEKVDAIMRECPSLTCKLLVTEDTYAKRTGWHNFTELYNQMSPEHTCVQTRSDEAMTIFFTSGTTGDPKMTEHTHASYGLASVITGRHWLDLHPNDVHWNLSDTGWAKSAWSNLFAPWMQGACVFIHDSKGFIPQQVMEIMDRYPVNTFCAPPTAYRMLAHENFSKYDLASVRHSVSAGEPLNPEVIDVWHGGTGQVIREGYGQTETVLQCGSFRCIPNKPGSMGKPSPGMDLTVIDEDGNEVATGKEGDLALRVKPNRPVGLFSRYVDEPQKTAETFRGDYYVTGDKGMKDEEGYMWFVGRADDVILSAGYRIGPFEVENALMEHPAVFESAAVSSPDSIRGEVVKAFIVLTSEYKEADKESLKKDIQEHVKRVTAPYKYPRKIEFLDALPKTVSLKTRRVELRNKEWDRE